MGCSNHIEVLVQNLNQFSTQAMDDFGGFKDMGWIMDAEMTKIGGNLYSGLDSKIHRAVVRFWIATRSCFN